ncbi:MAG: hypothetical protein HQL68_09180 [Magnetococcales bacterium]|nr:hypothetical protein [Magnetococcales bacterium]
MNMLPGKARVVDLKNSWVLAIILFFMLSGCSQPDNSHLDPKIFANDTHWQSIQLYFAPESYWQDKKNEYSAQVDVTRKHFFVESQRYRDLLTVRREEVGKAISEAKQRKEDPKTARQKIIKLYREKLDPQRAITREIGKKLRKDLAILDQIRHELFKAQL